MTEDEMVGWHHRCNGHEFEQAPGDGEGQGSLLCCSPWGHRESDMCVFILLSSERTDLMVSFYFFHGYQVCKGKHHISA